MQFEIFDRIRLPFRKDKELYLSIYRIIGFYPHEISYYKMALMHRSVMHRNKKGRPVNNERLEFLGDAILDAAVGDIVYRHFPGKREGFLTNTRSKLVQRGTLNKLAQEMGITELVLSSGRNAAHNNYMGGNAFEALVGALYLDRGYNACMSFLKKRILAQMINIDKVAYKEVNFKSRLIEWTQKNRVKLQFCLVSETRDKNGSPSFVYQAVLEGVKGCQGSGFSKKESQQNASKDTLDRLKREPQFIEAVFKAKGERTKMEEEPVEAVPDTGDTQDFMMKTKQQTDARTIPDNEKHATIFTEHVYSETESAETEKSVSDADTQNLSSINFSVNTLSSADDNDEFDLSDISAREQSREEIIAAAEKEAFKE